MRKRIPNAVIDQFQAEFASTLADWRVLTGSTLGKVAGRATMDAFARAAVAFERFRSDWHIAAITRDASVFSATQLNRAKEALKETKRDSLAPFIQVTIPTHPTLDQVGALLDATGSNVSLPNIGAWKKKARSNSPIPGSARSPVSLGVTRWPRTPSLQSETRHRTRATDHCPT